MISQEFNILSKDLQTLAKIVPLNWGAIQNNGTDGKVNMFQINSFKELESQIIKFTEEDGFYGNVLDVMNIFLQ